MKGEGGTRTPTVSGAALVHRIIPSLEGADFAGSRDYDIGMSETEPPKPDDYVETARDRRIANALLLFFLLLVVGGGVWLANAMFEQRRLDDCIARGRTNCAAPLDVPAR